MKTRWTVAILDDMKPKLEKILNTGSSLPARVLLQRLECVRFVPFVTVLTPQFFDQLLRFLTRVGESGFFVITVDPTLESHLGDFESGGYFHFSTGDSSLDYLTALHEYPDESRADSLACHGTQFLISSASCTWAVLADRDSDLVVCGFETRAIAAEFENEFEDRIFTSVMHAAKYAYGESERVEEYDALVSNYS